jgi:hypothetical protein
MPRTIEVGNSGKHIKGPLPRSRQEVALASPYQDEDLARKGSKEGVVKDASVEGSITPTDNKNKNKPIIHEDRR